MTIPAVFGKAEEVAVYDGPAELARVAELRFADVITRAVKARGRCHVALAGGSTPRHLYERLAKRTDLPWGDCELWLGDERWVSVTSDQSNARMIRETLLDGLGAAAPRFHSMPTNTGIPADAADAYARHLTETVPAGDRGWPQLDLVLLGVGADGHTASLFPHTTVLDTFDRAVAAVYVPQLEAWRLTLTRPVIEAARGMLFLVAGADKADILARLHSGKAPESPLHDLDPGGRVTWLLDHDAARRLELP